MTDEVMTESVETPEAEATVEESTPEDLEAKPTAEGEGVDNAESGEAKESSDDDAEKGEGDEEGDDDSGEIEYSAEDFELPEGVELDEEMMGGFMEIAKAEKYSKESAQKLVSLYAEKQQKALDAQLQQWDDTRKGWQSEVKADKEIGGKALDENMALAQKALSKFGSKELKEFGEHYGWADHPEYLKMLVRVGKTLSEDSSAKGQGDNQTSIEDRWYSGSSD